MAEISIKVRCCTASNALMAVNEIPRKIQQRLQQPKSIQNSCSAVANLKRTAIYLQQQSSTLGFVLQKIQM